MGGAPSSLTAHSVISTPLRSHLGSKHQNGDAEKLSLMLKLNCSMIVK